MQYLSSQSTIDSKIYGICDILRRSNCASALQYIPELTWILFLRILDDREEMEAQEAEALGLTFNSSLEAPYRWRDWAAPDGVKRKNLQDSHSGAFFNFVNHELLPYLRNLTEGQEVSPRRMVISQIMEAVDQVRIDTERNLLDVLDQAQEIHLKTTDPTHVFLLSQAYEGLLLRMGEKRNDGGQFFTPREVIRAMVATIDPSIGETVYDPACGTGGFLAQSYEYMKSKLGHEVTGDQLEQLGTSTFFGREKENLIYPIVLANLILHGIDQPNIWHGNTLTLNSTYDGLFQNAPDLYDVILINPPFGGREGQDAQTRYNYKTASTQVLFLQEVIDSLRDNGRAGIVVDEGLLFRTKTRAFVQTKRKLLDECSLWCVISLPSGVFTQAGASVKTNLLFFTKGKPTENTWYYDLSDVKVTKRRPLTLSHFDEFFGLLPGREEGERSWTVSRTEIESRNFDLKARNPNRVVEVDTRTPEDLISAIQAKGREIDEALTSLKELL